MSTNAIMDAFSTLKRQLNLILSDELKSINFGYQQLMIVFRLNESAASMSELSTFCSSDPASTTRTVASLEKAGLVRRLADPDDSRKTIVELSRKGQRRGAEAQKIRVNIGNMLSGTLTEKEQQTFIQLLNKVSSGLKEKKLKRNSAV